MLKKDLVTLIISIIIFSGCSPEKGSFFEAVGFKDNIIVANNASRNVVLLDENGVFIQTLVELQPGNVPWGLTQLDISTLLVSIEGTDRIISTDLLKGSSSQIEFLLNSNLSGTIRGLTRLASGDILINETNAVERFTIAGSNVTSGGWPQTLQTTPTNIVALPSGGFIQCSTNTDRIRTHTDAGGAFTFEAQSGIGGTTDATNCAVSATGQVAVAWNGTTDTVRVYTDSTYATTQYSFANAALLANPVALAFKSNGNLLAVDGTTNLIVEISPLGVLVRVLQSSQIATANNILVVR